MKGQCQSTITTSLKVHITAKKTNKVAFILPERLGILIFFATISFTKEEYCCSYVSIKDAIFVVGLPNNNNNFHLGHEQLKIEMKIVYNRYQNKIAKSI